MTFHEENQKNLIIKKNYNIKLFSEKKLNTETENKSINYNAEQRNYRKRIKNF